MLDLKLRKPGSILIHNGNVEIDGFEADEASCRETVALALLWAIGELQRELSAVIEKPGGGNAALDFSSDLRSALGMPDPWEKQQ